MLITHSDIRLFYKCPMLLYLSYHGPEDEMSVHPILKTRKRDSQSKELTYKQLASRINNTSIAMENEKRVVNQGWIGNKSYASKVDNLERIQADSPSKSSVYVPIFYRSNPRAKKPLMMEGTFSTYILTEFYDNPVDYFVIRSKNGDTEYTVDGYQTELTSDLTLIYKLKSGEKTITPNYTRGCRVCEWRYYCRNLAAETLDLTLVSGIGKRAKKILFAHDITDIPSLAKADLSTLDDEELIAKDLEYFKLQATSLMEKKAIIRKKLSLPNSKVELFVDVEGSSHHDFVWIIGCTIRRNGEVEYKSFIANSPKEEKSMMVSFLDFISNIDESYTLYHWSAAEPQYFANLAAKYHLSLNVIRKIHNNSLDLFDIFKENIILPIYTYTLKDVANWLGFKWHEPLTDGATSIILFDNWYLRNDRKSLEKAIAYNSDDCKALLIAKDYVLKSLS
ncbi:MAG: TM0106 family RecB-like putative nuclease [Candidatus Heimdallarchaeota archaeon]|nr:TM0106 family RecB-like putative nuclease [Candidatus Heimdallarchaeota archaeon]